MVSISPIFVQTCAHFHFSHFPRITTPPYNRPPKHKRKDFSKHPDNTGKLYDLMPIQEVEETAEEEEEKNPRKIGGAAWKAAESRKVRTRRRSLIKIDLKSKEGVDRLVYDLDLPWKKKKITKKNLYNF